MSVLRILFIINPISGGKQKKEIEVLIAEVIDSQKFSSNINYSEYIGHANELAREAIEGGYNVVVAVGGDGTINEVAAALIGTRCILGVVPYGSGNGLARFLNIPMSVKRALRLLNNQHIKEIDTATLNGRPFINMAGVGFDAAVSYDFAFKKQRGASTYVKTAVQKFLKYQPSMYRIHVDGVLYKRDALAISIANSSQYGNDFRIAPLASITDGVLDICVIKPLSWSHLPKFFWQIFFGKKPSADSIEIIKGKRINIELTATKNYIHLDGEAFDAPQNLEIEVKPLSLNVITPL